MFRAFLLGIFDFFFIRFYLGLMLTRLWRFGNSFARFLISCYNDDIKNLLCISIPMLNTMNQTTSFDKFLFSHFNLQEAMSPVLEAQETAVIKLEKCKTAVKKSIRKNTTLVSKKKCSEVLKQEPLKAPEPVLASAELSLEPEVADLAKVIDSIPDKVRAMNIEELAHKHESEWYHAFRDLKEEISREISQKHPDHVGTLKLKSEVKDITTLLDEHIEKAILEIERIFQAFPVMSRVALIYLLSIIISIPLMFFSVGTGKDLGLEKIGMGIITAPQNTIQLTQEMKADYIAKNSEKILSSGQAVYRVEDLPQDGQVAGAYEDKDQDPGRRIKDSISHIYRSLADVGDEFELFFQK